MVQTTQNFELFEKTKTKTKQQNKTKQNKTKQNKIKNKQTNKQTNQKKNGSFKTIFDKALTPFWKTFP